MKKLYEYTCPFCENYEKLLLDLDNIDSINCKKCNQLGDNENNKCTECYNNYILENENCIISQIVKELGIDANQYKSIYSIFSKKYQKGFYRTENSQKYSSSTNNAHSNRNKSNDDSTGSKSNNSKKNK